MNLPSNPVEAPMDRRRAIQWMLAAAASMAVPIQGQAAPTVSYTPVAGGYGTDPLLAKAYSPGDFWPLTLTDAQRQSVAFICDLIFPADDISPSASALKVQDFVDEWISAPYPTQQADRKPVLDCVQWFESEAQKRFRTPLLKLKPQQANALCDDVAFGAKRKVFAAAAANFARFKFIVAGGFYSTPEGMRDIGYVGNVPLVNYEGASPEALKHLGIE